MGLFTKKEACSICGDPNGVLKLANGQMCYLCHSKALGFIPLKPHKGMVVNEIVTMNNMNHPVVSIDFITSEIKKNYWFISPLIQQLKRYVCF